MHTFRFFLFVFLAQALFGQINQTKISSDLEVLALTDSVFVITHQAPFPANSLLVQLKSGDLILVDTPYTPQATDTLLLWISNTFHRSLSCAINGHFHIDCLGGNESLIKHQIPVYGSNLTVKLLSEKSEAMRQQFLGWLDKQDADFHIFEAMTFYPPTHTFQLEENQVIHFDNSQVCIDYLGAAHAPDNIVVYFPEQKILFAGCMLITWNRIGNTTDADMAQWPGTVSRLFDYDFQFVIPGHGHRFDRSLIDHTLYLLNKYDKEHP